MKKAAIAFAVIAILLSDIMCAVVASVYRDMLYGIKHLGYSAPPSVAFLYAIPFMAGIIICAVLAGVFSRNQRNRFQFILIDENTAKKAPDDR